MSWLRAFLLRGRATFQKASSRFFLEECYFCDEPLEGTLQLEIREGCEKETKLLGHAHYACVRRNQVEQGRAACWAHGLGYCLPVKGRPSWGAVLAEIFAKFLSG
jgi:hypothetical protein